MKQKRGEDLLARYKERLEAEIAGQPEVASRTSEYTQFRKEIIQRRTTKYEKYASVAGSLLNLGPDKKKTPKLKKAIEQAHLTIRPKDATSFGMIIPIVIMLIGGFLAFAVFQSLFMVALMLVLGLVLIKPISDMPIYIASYHRLKASNQMVLCIFYIVTYMRHTSNLERAIQFAAEHLGPPLSLDLKKVLWDVETEKVDTLKESLDVYLEGWRESNMEFVEAFHLIESSLLEGEESRRLAALDKSLDVILEETYEKMLHYAHNLKSPITLLHMLGVILPILGLVILPLLVSFMEGVTWLHIAFFYNLIIPVAVYTLGRSILVKRPTGYGDTDISEQIPQLKKYGKILFKFGGKEYGMSPIYISIIIGVVLLFIGFLPIMLHAINPAFEFPPNPDARFKLMAYQQDSTGNVIGPFGLYSSLISLLVPLGLGVGIGLYYRLRSKNLLKIRDATQKLEDEFASALFQLGNRLGDNIPAEMAFGTVAEYMQDSASGKFFRLVSVNIQKLGMSVKQAIFDARYGALRFYPSRIIQSSMKVLIESIKKGPAVAAQSLTNIARYIKEIHRVNERLKDLMADIVSSMQSQIKFLSPAIAGIVIGITSMITYILAQLNLQLNTLQQGGQAGLGSAQVNLANIFGLGIPTYFFQIVVGVYVVQIVYILTVLSNGISNGSDALGERYALGQNMIKSTVMYVLISACVMILFNFIASNIMQSTF